MTATITVTIHVIVRKKIDTSIQIEQSLQDYDAHFE